MIVSNPAKPKFRHKRRAEISELDIDAGSFHLALSKRTYIMGVLNVTPDSFSERGKFFDGTRAIGHAHSMIRDGADIIDVGGESTRPGASSVDVEDELARVIPVIKEVARQRKVPISIDTRKSEVAEEAIKAGASIINDVSGLRHDTKMASVAARHDVALIVMHMKGTPHDMQINPTYKDLIKEILESLKESIMAAKKAGLKEKRLIVDPGIGFGKTVGHNLEILNRLAEFKILGRPICIGLSRKAFIGKVLGLDDPADRLSGTLGASAVAITKGANILRVHDVREALQVARIADSISSEKII